MANLVFEEKNLIDNNASFSLEANRQEEYFIPIVIEINGVRVPSTPFYTRNAEPLFLGDVFEVSFGGPDVYIYLVEMKNGQYVGTSSDPHTEEPIWIFDMETINNLGSSLKYPALLNRLS